MRTNYYLQQMGIEIWSLRTQPKPVYPKLCIISAAPLVNKAALRLLAQMMQMIDLESEEVCYLSCPLVTDASMQTLQLEIQRTQALAIMILGEGVAQRLLKQTDPLHMLRGPRHCLGEVPVIVSDDLADLLTHPLAKREAYRDWLALGRLLPKS